MERDSVDISGLSHGDALDLVVRTIDLTSLNETDTDETIRALCLRARHPDPGLPDLGPVAAVCVLPQRVRAAAEACAGTGVRVVSVAGDFPDAAAPLGMRLAEIRTAVDDGAQEIDIVINRAAFARGDDQVVMEEITAAKDACGTAQLKTILEAGEIEGSEGVRHAATLAMRAGTDFIKTSTGMTPVGATPDTVRVMATAIRDHHADTGRRIGLKVAGGVRRADEALTYVSIVSGILGDVWLDPTLFRIGASRLLDDVIRQRHALAVDE